MESSNDPQQENDLLQKAKEACLPFLRDLNFEPFIQQLGLSKEAIEVDTLEIALEAFLTFNKKVDFFYNTTPFKKRAFDEKSFKIWFDNFKQALSSEKGKQHFAYLIKIAALFGNKEQTNNYLLHFSDYIDPFHDAALFQFPPNGWNKEIWRAILKNNPPQSENDYLLHILSITVKIQDYINLNGDQLLEDIKKEIRMEFEIKYKEEYENLKKTLINENEWISLEIKKNNKKIEKKIDQLFLQEVLCPALGINYKNKLTPQNLQDIAQLKNKLSSEQKEARQQISKRLYLKFENEFKATYKKLSVNIEKSETQYVNEMMEANLDAIWNKYFSKMQKIFSDKTTLVEIDQYVSKVGPYENTKKNPVAAALFFSHRIREEKFNLYLTLKPKDSELIPNVVLDLGKMIDKAYDGYYLKKIDSHDPLCAVLGEQTSCCQSLGFEAENCVIYGIEKENSGFYKLYTIENGKEINLAQTWAWRDNENNIVFDSIESNKQFREKIVKRNVCLLAEKINKEKMDFNTLYIMSEEANVLTGYWLENNEIKSKTIEKEKLKSLKSFIKHIKKDRYNYSKQMESKLRYVFDDQILVDELLHEFGVPFGRIPNLIQDGFVLLAYQLIEKHDVNAVFVGKGGQTPKDIAIFNPTFHTKPKLKDYYNKMNDSDNMEVLAYKNLLFLYAYLKSNNRSLLTKDILIKNEINFPLTLEGPIEIIPKLKRLAFIFTENHPRHDTDFEQYYSSLESLSNFTNFQLVSPRDEWKPIDVEDDLSSDKFVPFISSYLSTYSDEIISDFNEDNDGCSSEEKDTELADSYRINDEKKLRDVLEQLFSTQLGFPSDLIHKFLLLLADRQSNLFKFFLQHIPQSQYQKLLFVIVYGCLDQETEKSEFILNEIEDENDQKNLLQRLFEEIILPFNDRSNLEKMKKWAEKLYNKFKVLPDLDAIMLLLFKRINSYRHLPKSSKKTFSPTTFKEIFTALSSFYTAEALLEYKDRQGRSIISELQDNNMTKLIDILQKNEESYALNSHGLFAANSFDKNESNINDIQSLVTECFVYFSDPYFFGSEEEEIIDLMQILDWLKENDKNNIISNADSLKLFINKLYEDSTEESYEFTFELDELDFNNTYLQLETRKFGY